MNFEAQGIAADFTFKRHLYYWSMAYIFTIKEGQSYEKLLPTYSIVLYRNKPGAELIERAGLSGELIHQKEDGELLNMISVNASKWADAPSEELRQYLAILSNGICTNSNVIYFTGVDTNSEFFQSINKAVAVASAQLKFDDSKERRDDNMSDLLKGFLSEEEKQNIAERSKAEGVSEGAHQATLYAIAAMYRLCKDIDQLVEHYGEYGYTKEYITQYLEQIQLI